MNFEEKQARKFAQCFIDELKATPAAGEDRRALSTAIDKLSKLDCSAFPEDWRALVSQERDAAIDRLTVALAEADCFEAERLEREAIRESSIVAMREAEQRAGIAPNSDSTTDSEEFSIETRALMNVAYASLVNEVAINSDTAVAVIRAIAGGKIRRVFLR